MYLNGTIAITDKGKAGLFNSFFQSVFTTTHSKGNSKESIAKIEKIHFARAHVEKHWKTCALGKLKALMVWEIYH